MLQVRILLQGPNLLPPSSPAVAEAEACLRELLLELLLHVHAQVLLAALSDEAGLFLEVELCPF